MKNKVIFTFKMATPALLLAILLVLPWLWSPFFLDDWHNLWKAHEASWTLASLTDHFTFLDSSSIASWNLPIVPPYHFFRPLVVASFKFDMLWGGIAPFGLHFTNLILHLACILLVVRLTFVLSQDKNLAKWTGLFFALQPQNAVAVVWISGRTETMAALWLLAGLLSYIALRRSKQKRWFIALFTFQFLSMLSKENTVLLPAIIFAYEVIFERPKEDSLVWIRRAIPLYLPIVGVLFVYLIYRFFIFKSGILPAAPYMRSIFSLHFIPFILSKLSYYLFAIITTAFILPLFGTEYLIAHWWLLLLLIGLTSTIYWFFLRKIWRESLVQFGILLFIFSLIPTLTVLTTDLYLYFGSIGFAIVIAFFFKRLAQTSPKKQRLRLAYIVLFALGFFARGGFYYLNGHISEKIYTDIIKDTASKIPTNSTFFLVNMPFAASHLAPMLRLRLNNKDIHAILINVSSEWTIPTRKPSIQCLNNHSILIKPAPPLKAFFTTPEEWNLQLLRFPFDATHKYSIRGATVLPISKNNKVIALKITFKKSLKKNKNFIYLFHDDGKNIAHRFCHDDP